MHMKIGFEDRSYLLNRFPTTFADLLTQFIDKVKLTLGSQPSFYYVDNDGDMIVVADDSDLSNVKDVCRMEGKELCKLIVDRPATVTPKSTADNKAGTACGGQCNGFDSSKYYHFLKSRLPRFSEEFTECMNKGMPCEDCLGIGKSKDGSKCCNCYGRGIRPLNNQFKLMIQIMDFKLREYILEPLEIFVMSGGSTMDFPGKGTKKPFNQRGSSSSLEENPGKKESLGFPNSSIFGGSLKKDSHPDNQNSFKDKMKANLDD
jgi:PB1 domain